MMTNEKTQILNEQLQQLNIAERREEIEPFLQQNTEVTEDKKELQ